MSIYYRDDRVTLYHGDCIEVMASLPDASVDAVVTDPPYALGFMGRSWDTFGDVGRGAQARVQRSGEVTPGGEGHSTSAGPYLASGVDSLRSAGAPFQAWCEQWAREALRVLKPGGHLLAFGGTRTWHRLACAVEDAGFEVRDSIAWLYGCHDDRTEILTRRGWVNGLDLTEDDDVAQWATDGTISLVRPTARQRYDYDGPLVRFRNADVDQLVTPNHRVYLQTSDRAQVDGERRATWSDWQVKQAADVNRWQRMRLPAAGVHDGPGIGGTDYAALLGWVWAEGGFDASGTGVRIYQSSTNQPFVDEIAALMDRLGAHKRYDYAREWKGNPYTSTTWFVSGELANRVRADLPGKAPTYDLLWQMTADEKRALWDAAMKGDGSKAARTFWQKDRGALEWAQALLASIDCRGKVADDPRGALHWTTRPTVEMQARHLADASEDYLGEVWCVTVPSGAFIVRRNGRVSVSGNSGFPKSLDVSKAIDKAAGHERGRNPDLRNGPNTNPFTKGAATHGGGWAPLVGDDNGAQTPDAERWQGWGTALKPGHEPVVCARKPFNTVPLGEEVDRLHHLIGGLLWLSLSPAKRAELASPSSPAGQHGARCASALVSAATATSPDGFAQTGMCSSPATASTSSSIASSWSSILGALSALTSTSTTSTRSSTTTALTTLSSLLAPLTSPSTMPPCACLTSGSSSSAPSAGSDSTDEWARWLHTLSASVPASAIEGTALVVASALAQVAASLSADQGAASSADPSATTGADASPSPAFEPVVVARKPLIGTVAANVTTHGTGALNIDGCRIGLASGEDVAALNARSGGRRGFASEYVGGTDHPLPPGADLSKGRWPANVVLDDTQAAALDEQSGITTSTGGKIRSASRDSTQGASNGGTQGGYNLAGGAERLIRGDTGGASRFFYVAKAPASERPRYTRPKLRLRDDLTPAQVDHVRARLAEAGVQVD